MTDLIDPNKIENKQLRRRSENDLKLFCQDNSEIPLMALRLDFGLYRARQEQIRVAQDLIMPNTDQMHQLIHQHQA